MFCLQANIPLLGKSYDDTMRNIKSRTVVGRTIARVKSRIASFGSIAPPTTNSPNPLIAPPSFPTIRQVDGTRNEPLAHSPTKNDKGKGKETSRQDDGLLPRIATLKIAPSTWTLSSNPLYPKYAATAYVQFTFTCEPQNAAQPQHSRGPSMSSMMSPKTTAVPTVAIPDMPSLLMNPPGVLLNLTLTLSTTGPCVLVQSFGDLEVSCLGPDAEWVYVLHLGIKDTSLASKLNSSWKSLRKKASRSLKWYNMETIDRWLDVLTADKKKDDEAEDVVVKARVRYQHSFLPHEENGTWLEDGGSCKVSMNRADRQTARTNFQLGGDGIYEIDRKLIGDEELDDMMEEMVREHNVALGPPFML